MYKDRPAGEGGSGGSTQQWTRVKYTNLPASVHQRKHLPGQEIVIFGFMTESPTLVIMTRYKTIVTWVV